MTGKVKWGASQASRLECTSVSSRSRTSVFRLLARVCQAQHQKIKTRKDRHGAHASALRAHDVLCSGMALCICVLEPQR